jgi:hypothetical protein
VRLDAAFRMQPIWFEGTARNSRNGREHLHFSFLLEMRDGPEMELCRKRNQRLPVLCPHDEKRAGTGPFPSDLLESSCVPKSGDGLISGG